MAKEFKEIKTGSVDSPRKYSTFHQNIKNIAQDPGEPANLAGQDISASSKGNIYTGDVDIHSGPSYGDVVHGANKYKMEDGNVMDHDFTYRPSTRKSSQGDDVKHWTITGHK